MADKHIHFGHFIRWARVRNGWSLRKLGAEAGGLSEKRVWQIEQMSEPASRDTTLAALAKAFGIDPEEFDRVWRSTPVTNPDIPEPESEIYVEDTFEITVPPAVLEVIKGIAEEKKIPMAEAAQEWANSLDADLMARWRAAVMLHKGRTSSRLADKEKEVERGGLAITRKEKQA